MSDFGEGDWPGGVATLDGLGGVACQPAVRAACERALAAMPPTGALGLAQPLSRVRFAGFIATAKALSAHLDGLDGLSDALRKLIAYGPRRSADDWAEDRAILAETSDAVRSAGAAQAGCHAAADCRSAYRGNPAAQGGDVTSGGGGRGHGFRVVLADAAP